MNKQTVHALNTFLKGNYMAIQSYEGYIQQIEDQEVKQVFQKIKANHQQHAQLVSQRIIELGGEAVEGAGLVGKMVDWIQDVKGKTTEMAHIIKDAQAGEERGIKKSKELLEGDLDEKSLSLVKRILSKDEEHVALLTKLLPSNL